MIEYIKSRCVKDDFPFRKCCAALFTCRIFSWLIAWTKKSYHWLLGNLNGAESNAAASGPPMTAPSGPPSGLAARGPPMTAPSGPPSGLAANLARLSLNSSGNVFPQIRSWGRLKNIALSLLSTKVFWVLVTVKLELYEEGAVQYCTYVYETTFSS